jgi:hypothetical protein
MEITSQQVGFGEIPMDEEEWDDLERVHLDENVIVMGNANVEQSRRRGSIICPIYKARKICPIVARFFHLFSLPLNEAARELISVILIAEGN